MKFSTTRMVLRRYRHLAVAVGALTAAWVAAGAPFYLYH